MDSTGVSVGCLKVCSYLQCYLTLLILQIHIFDINQKVLFRNMYLVIGKTEIYLKLIVCFLFHIFFLKKILYKGDSSELPIFLQICNMRVSKKDKCDKIQFSDTMNLSNVMEMPLSTEKNFQLHAIVKITGYKVIKAEQDSSMLERYANSFFYLLDSN